MDSRNRGRSAGHRADWDNQASRREAARRRSERKRASDNEVIAKRRTKLTLLVVGFIVVAVVALFDMYMQYVQAGTDYHIAAIRQNIRANAANDRIITPNRGSIVDRNMQTLAVSSTVYNVFVDIRMMVERNDALFEANMRALTEFFGLNLYEFQQLVAINPHTGNLINDTHFYIIEWEVPHSIMMEFEAWRTENQLVVRDVHFEYASRRSYLHGSLAAPVVGFYRGEWWGLERRYDSFLTGRQGRSLTTFADFGNIITDRIEPEHGNTLVTTLDIGIQRAAEEIVRRYTHENQASHGSAIVMNPNTGAIIAMAQYPSFDANFPAELDSLLAEHLTEQMSELDPNSAEFFDYLFGIWANFNVTATFEPGSTYKSLTIAKALEEGVIHQNQTFYCSGFLYVADHMIRCSMMARGGGGLQTLEEVLANSCNVGTMLIAQELGRELFWRYQRDFGFGIPTGIDLPAENSGLVFSINDLNDSELATSSFGQRFTATPIQVISAYAALVNGGNIMRPHVVSHILDSDSNVIYQNLPHIDRRVISEQTSAWVRSAMESVLTIGTGQAAYIAGHSAGGKTSTAEQGLYDTEDFSWSLSYVGYFPINNPQYMVMVLLHEVPNEVYQIRRNQSTPMYRELATEIIRLRNLPPDGDAQINIAGINNFVVVENYIDMNISAAIAHLNSIRLSYEFIGASGTHISSQFPAAGTLVTDEAHIILNIEDRGGLALAAVPNVVGLDANFAQEILAIAGFVPRIIITNLAQGHEHGLLDAGDTPMMIVDQKLADQSLPIGSEILLFAQILIADSYLVP